MSLLKFSNSLLRRSLKAWSPRLACAVLVSGAVAFFARSAYSRWTALHDDLWSNVDIGKQLIEKKQYAQALTPLNTALMQAQEFEGQRIWIPFLPRIRDSVIYILYNLNTVYKAQKEFPLQESVCKRIVARSQSLYGPESWQSKRGLIALLKAYESEGKYAAAAAAFRETMPHLASQLPTSSRTENAALVEDQIAFLHKRMEEDMAGVFR
jgi:hypothetical protein